MSNRTKIVSVKFSENELEKVDRMAFKTCRMRSTFIREVVLGYAPKEKPSDDFKEVIRQLRYLNNNLNQLTVKAHSLDYIDEKKCRKQLKQINELVIDMRRKYLTNEE